MTAIVRFAERFLPICVLAISAISVPMMVLAPTGLRRLEALQDEKRKVDLEISHLSDEIRRLRSEVSRIKDDPSKVEQAARDQLGLVRQTEIVFQFGP
jgi:cell division protein FtsB